MIGAKNEIRKVINEITDEIIQRDCLNYNYEWHFSHMGESWNRLVRTVITVFKKLLKEQSARTCTLRNIFCEIEDIINC